MCSSDLHLLGDGKSCAGLERLERPERLPSYESFSYGYRGSQPSPERRSFQHQYHSLASQSYHSYTASGGRYRLRTRREAPPPGPRLACPQGYEAGRGRCLGNYGGGGVWWSGGGRSRGLSGVVLTACVAVLCFGVRLPQVCMRSTQVSDCGFNGGFLCVCVCV